MTVSISRIIAYEILRRVESEGAYASDLLHADLVPNTKPEDAALATEIVMGVLRWRRQLDVLIEKYTKKLIARLDLAVAITLRMGIYQLRFLDRVPARAAVNESVEIVKRARKASAATLVNAVLRRAAEEARKPAEQLLGPISSNAERLAILHSHPTWMVERWMARLGESQKTVALLESNNRTPRLSCAIHDVSQLAEVTNELRTAGLRILPGEMLKSAFAVSGGSPARTEAFRAGKISIQDEASQLVPLLLNVQSGDRVLDLCAAPGGKTSALARGAGAGGLVVAGERHAHRLRAMRDQFKRLGLNQVRLVEVDAERVLPFGIQFDRILVDAPCSGTGTLARHPEIRWRLRPEQLAEFHRLQCALLENAIEALGPNGWLVYSTCSIEPEENEEVVRDVLQKRGDVRLIGKGVGPNSLRDKLIDNADVQAFFDQEGYFRTSPSEHTSDGFFAAVIGKSDG
jgi:16S rRNA (cytosine967-C5)-methyltransferase